jgi:hypothetical protein
MPEFRLAPDEAGADAGPLSIRNDAHLLRCWRRFYDRCVPLTNPGSPP